jgi:RNA-binding protein
MKYIHNVTVSVFAREEEDKIRIQEAMIGLLPEIDFEKEKVSVVSSTVEAHDKSLMYTYSLKVHKQRHVRHLLSVIFNSISPEEKQKLYDQRDNRIDGEGCFFLRLDKEFLMSKSKYKITDGGKCFHVRIKLAAYPKSKENAVKVFEELFASL